MGPILLTAAGAIAAAIALSFAIPALVRRAKIDALATLLIEPEQQVELPAGDVILHLAGPFGKIGLGSLSFQLISADGRSMPSEVIVFRSRRSSGLWGVLLAVRRFHIEANGEYRLKVTDIPAQRDLTDCRLVLARPQDAGLVLSILGVVVASVVLIVCSVLSLILWLSPAAFAQSATAADTALESSAGLDSIPPARVK